MGLTEKVHFSVVGFYEDLIPGIFLSAVPTFVFPIARYRVPRTLMGGCVCICPLHPCATGKGRIPLHLDDEC